jgi:hypothetical protein
MRASSGVVTAPVRRVRFGSRREQLRVMLTYPSQKRERVFGRNAAFLRRKLLIREDMHVPDMQKNTARRVRLACHAASRRLPR